MRLFLKDYINKYKAENIIRLFFPDIQLCHGKREGDDYIYQRNNKNKCYLVIKRGGKTTVTVERYEDLEKYLYNFLKQYTGIKPPWGMLCGVRPLWLYRQRITSGMDAKQTINSLTQGFDVSNDKAVLLKACYDTQEGMSIERSVDNFSLYVSIPYCPSRCRYCSFISMASNNHDEMERYINHLIDELHTISAQSYGRLQTIYIGGGTPTVIDAKQLSRLMDAINKLFPDRLEFTVEAGRPDCTDREKLSILKAASVDRLSINPQTFCDDILKGIGRHHTAEDVVRCYNDALLEGHKNINMDLIAGLPGDTAQGFKYSLQRTLELDPAGITVHSFTKKSGSMLSGGDFSANPELMEMMHLRDEMLAAYNPYYIYRQKKTPANLENVGYAKPGYECLYNVYMMDELHTVVSAGAGGVTKYVGSDRSSIKREFHPKYPTEYIANRTR